MARSTDGRRRLKRNDVTRRTSKAVDEVPVIGDVGVHGAELGEQLRFGSVRFEHDDVLSCRFSIELYDVVERGRSTRWVGSRHWTRLEFADRCTSFLQVRGLETQIIF